MASFEDGREVRHVDGELAADRQRLKDLVAAEADTYRVVRSHILARVADPPSDPAAYADVSSFEAVLGRAIFAVGAGDAAPYDALVPRAVAQVTVLDATYPDGVQPNLTVLNVINDLELMGCAMPAAPVARARDWLVGMRTENLAPDYWHWQRGFAALALADLRTARTIAALPESGATGVDPDSYPEFNIQAWLAFWVAAVVDGLPWPVVVARWEEFLLLAPIFRETGVFSAYDLTWAARVVHNLIAAQPLSTTADWLQAELTRVVE